MPDIKEAIEKNKDMLGIHQYGFMTTDKISIDDGVRKLCEANSCGRYGKSWACPPGVGTIPECREKIMSYKNVFVYTTKHDLEDSFDFEGMMAGKDAHEEISKGVVRFFSNIYKGDKLVLSGDGCDRCKKCTYPDAPCRFEGEVFPTVESYGVEVYKMAEVSGVNYINGVNTVTYFGCIFY